MVLPSGGWGDSNNDERAHQQDSNLKDPSPLPVMHRLDHFRATERLTNAYHGNELKNSTNALPRLPKRAPGQCNSNKSSNSDTRVSTEDAATVTSDDEEVSKLRYTAVNS
jgi:hypothetical protein